MIIFFQLILFYFFVLLTIFFDTKKLSVAFHYFFTDAQNNDVLHDLRDEYKVKSQGVFLLVFIYFIFHLFFLAFNFYLCFLILALLVLAFYKLVINYISKKNFIGLFVIRAILFVFWPFILVKDKFDVFFREKSSAILIMLIAILYGLLTFWTT